ncbi:MAG TPA: dihydrofolate reductase family protein [Anaerolineales bacterium]|nr:dihydrofolate reductase family protein [Anaerolineales bacterium]
MKLVVNTFVTLDGVMQAPGGPDEDREGGFPYGGWSVPFFDDVMGKTVFDSMARASAFLLGRKTYDIFAAYWPNPAAPEDQELAGILNPRPKHVASTTLAKPGWQNTFVIQGDVVDAVRRLKEQPGEELNVQGSSRLLQSIHGLVDEYRLWICPVHLGAGKRLFDSGSPAAGLELVGTKTNSRGAIYAVYRPTGSPKTGMMGA